MSTTNKKRTTKTENSARAKESQTPRPYRREVCAAICFFLGLFSFIGYFDVDAWFINFFCKTIIRGLIGYGYYIFPLALLACAFLLTFHHGRPVRLRAVSVLLLPLFLGAIVHLFAYRFGISRLELSFDPFGELLKILFESGCEMQSGGALSGLLAMSIAAMFSIYGAIPVLIFAFITFVFLALRVAPSTVAQKLKSRERREYEPQPEPPRAPPRAPQPKRNIAAPSSTRRKGANYDIALDDDETTQEEHVEKKAGFFNAAPRAKTPDEIIKGHSPTDDVLPLTVEEAADIAGVDIMSEEIRTEEPLASMQPASKKTKLDSAQLEMEREEIAREIRSSAAIDNHTYTYPPASLLTLGAGGAVDGREEMKVNRERLQSTLDSFGVNAAISDITRGPTVTRYDLELEAGVKLTKLTNLADDLALSLGVSGVRIAPIPDKISTVGVEVPNKIVSMVYLRDIIESGNFSGAPSKLSFAVGKDIGGNSVVGNIAKLPHMLIAGTTGSGKSVCMNSLILSLLFKASPEEVRLIMIDPKMVELGIYNGIPHLYIPVVTDPKKAAGALQWTVVEMLKRYRLFSEEGVRDLEGYNKIQRGKGEAILPQVVIVIDELADLMLVASKEVEDSICRVAQMGRASGMHLVIATQRPSADVITGLMKANIPSRIAFSVSSALESRIILDSQGAEKLVGNGDMLYSPIGSGKPRRIQGAFVSDDEREKVVSFIKTNSEPQYNDEIQAEIDKAAQGKAASTDTSEADSPSDADQSEYDAMLPQAADVIFDSKQASVSMLQRRLKLGYSRAARIVDQLEELGVLGPFEGSKPRQILITKEQWHEMQMASGAAPPESGEAQMSMYDFSEAEDIDE